MLGVDSRGTTWDRVSGRFSHDVRFIDEALAHAFARVPVDPLRSLLMGFSDGASYALSLGPPNGDLFSHVMAFSPGFAAPEVEMIGTPGFFVGHGKRDTILSVTNTRDWIVPDLQNRGYDVTYVEFDGGHNMPRELVETAFDWYLSEE